MGLFARLAGKDKDIPSEAKVVEFLNNTFADPHWFIAGSYAHPRIKSPNDIDIFFNTEQDYNRAVLHLTEYLKLTSKRVRPIDTTTATSFYVHDIDMRVQLIKKHFGNVDQIFDTFDLNVCKHAILPDGSHISDPSAKKDIRIDRINFNTFDRYFKYMAYLGLEKEIPIRGKTLINQFIGDSTLIEDYYDEVEGKAATNKVMFRKVCAFRTLKKYAHEQAMIHAPELLI